MSWLFYLTIFVLKIFFSICTRLKVNGRENIPHAGPLVVVANHITYAEPLLIGTLIGRNVRFATKEGFFHNIFIKTIMEALGCFPVYQGRADRKTIRLMEQYVKDGFALVIFPEGTRSLHAELLPALNGAALIAHRTDAPILPLGIYGTEKMRGKTWYFKRPVIEIRFGKLFQLPPKNGKADREADTRLIMEHIAELLPPEYHGVYTKEGSK